MVKEKKVAVVTGSGQGLGQAIGEDLAQRGFSVVIAERDANRAALVAAGIQASGGDATAAPVDVTNPQDVAGMIEAARMRYGRIDVLVNSARWSALKATPVTEITDLDWQIALNVNVTGAFNCVRATVPTMIEQQGGRIIFLSSATVTLPPRQPYVHYITTKAALIGMTRALARELGQHRITVNAVLPGSVETGADRPGLSDSDRRQRAAQDQSIPEVIQSSDLTGLVAFLASPESRQITGQSLTVDGGRSFL